MTSTPIRVLIADDHALIRQGIRRILEYEADIRVVGEAENGRETLGFIKMLKPDLLIMDINMPQLTGFQVLEKLHEMDMDQKTILLTVNDDSTSLHMALDTGADAYVLKDSNPEDLIAALHEVMKGENYIDKRLVKLLVNGYKTRNHEGASKIEELTDREAEVLSCISRGLTNKEIADKLFITEKTVKNHTTHIYRKLEVTDRVKAALYAIDNIDLLPDI